MKKFFSLLLVLTFCLVLTASAESIKDYVESRGFTIADISTAPDEYKKCYLQEDKETQSFCFTEDGQLYIVVGVYNLDVNYDASTMRNLFLDVLKNHAWDRAWYWPDYDIGKKIKYSYGLMTSLDMTEWNTYDFDEFMRTLSDEFDPSQDKGASVANDEGNSVTPPDSSSPMIDISAYSFEELIDLRNQVDAALWASDGWQSVAVPSGMYKVGEDIPAGRWTITAGGTGSVTLYKELDEYGEGSSTIMYTPYMHQGDTANLDLRDGQYIKIDQLITYFSPYVGASLGFK